jgi:histidinol phosphatase-like enzyme
MPDAIIAVGSPCSGKTAFFETIKNDYVRIDKDKSDVVISDVIRDAIAEDKGVYIDGCNPNYFHRKHCIETLLSFNQKVLCYWFCPPVEESFYHGSVNRADDKLCFPSIYNYERRFDEPYMREGFSSIKKIKLPVVPEKFGTKKAVFINLNNTIVTSKSGINFPIGASDYEFMDDNTRDVLIEFKKKKYLIIVVPNGFCDVTSSEFHAEFLAKHIFETMNVKLDRVCICIPKIRTQLYRIPNPDPIIELSKELKIDMGKSLFIGNRFSDMALSRTAGIKHYFNRDSFFMSTDFVINLIK